MKEAEELVGALHVAYPGIPGAVLDPVSETREENKHGQGGEWGMASQGDVAQQAPQRPQEGDSSLAEAVVNEVVGERGQEVAEEGG